MNFKHLAELGAAYEWHKLDRDLVQPSGHMVGNVPFDHWYYSFKYTRDATRGSVLQSFRAAFFELFCMLNDMSPVEVDFVGCLPWHFGINQTILEVEGIPFRVSRVFDIGQDTTIIAIDMFTRKKS